MESGDCPHCGEPLPRGALSCRHCGSDAETGWASEEEIQYRSVEIPGQAPPSPRRSLFRGRRLTRVALGLLALALAAWILAALL